MKTQDALHEGRELIRDLRRLNDMESPDSLLPGVLTQVGLADAYWRLETPLGAVFVAYGKSGITAVTHERERAEFEGDYELRFRRPIFPVQDPPAGLSAAVTAQLAGSPAALAFDLRGLSEFEQAVLRKALEIPHGQIRPYGWIAREIGNPRAVRAVGTALANNPIPLLIPCHRVVRSDGHIGNYGLGGSDAKRIILEAEGVAVDSVERAARSGARYYGSDSTRIYCFPTCAHARRISDVHRVTFRSDQDAAAAGYRPCKVCRPSLAS